MTLVDTSVWIKHLRSGSEELAALLRRGGVLSHPLVIGELACGNLRNRKDVLRLLNQLPQAPVSSHDEALTFIEQRSLMGKSIGFIDVHLLASVTLAGTARLWTRDKRLAATAQELGFAYIPSMT